ncbi:tRNA (adenosine(37)-N6)-threonylcarbamoyltransferase complex dimerization subunit type 1 TsaB [Hydrocarboniphaga sp.]|uniref:tRNA (adenosine(37)-N6)-threonylcarbamoyltransferase complex dimerization subunit type 1 TsaB n=1 Tax=Hydrocarboniphaga sp. TaxID=2033016 RepID=UPI002AB9AA9B|nr:tRNA (adenosine(37)-N6)-threonylcarbamoyltransferase complex dimerization subunit type 1 TsaB [Hydrocarboniphaga sp.]MDZ4080073.1 tRNA (adenosine(37)-N6)-threonylcarbamoyltransferase complex dimerization subunit type 1 TsaB [Hydrocarboniphaga sp.]
MRLLAVDTATEACSVALWLDGEAVERYEVAGRTHTERLLPLVQQLLAETGVRPAQLDGLVAGIGPGSFAGVRIAVGFVKGLALALDRPVVGVSSLAMLAQGAIEAGAERVMACIDARMSEVYWGAYERGPGGLARALLPDRVMPPGAIEADLVASVWVAAGTGWGTYEALLKQRLKIEPSFIDGQALPHAAAALRLALPAFASGQALSGDELAPAYLRDRVALTLVEQQAARAAKADGAGF